MASALSPQMSANLVALTSINTDMAATQGRLATGKKVSTVLDGAALFFRAKGLSEKAEALDPVNANISAAISNVKIADKAISTMYDNLSGLLSTLKDARSKPITATTAINTTSGADQRTSYAAVGSLVQAAPVGAAPAVDVDDPSKFQTGDLFAISFTNAAGLTTTRFFEAGAAVTGKTGLTDAAAMRFTDGASLMAAFTTVFGTDDIALTFNAAGDPNKFVLSATNPATTITISQTSNAAPANIPAGTPNSFLDFDKIFGTSTSRVGGAAVQVQNGTALLNVVGTQVTYTGTGASAASAANLETRRLARDTYAVVLQQINNLAKDGYLTGFNNLLTGSTMTVDLNEDTGDVVQNVTIGAVDPAALGFAGFVASTGRDDIASFNSDTLINQAVNRVTGALTILRARQNALASHTSMLSTRMDFNKNAQTITGDVANAITTADLTEEAARAASLQTLQTFSTNNITMTNTAEKSLIQILR